MSLLKTIAAIGLTVAIGVGLTGCGWDYTGEGVITKKEIDKTYTSKTKSKSGSSKTHYEITVDIPTSDENHVVNVSKEKYDTLKVDQKVQLQEGKIK